MCIIYFRIPVALNKKHNGLWRSVLGLLIVIFTNTLGIHILHLFFNAYLRNFWIDALFFLRNDFRFLHLLLSKILVFNFVKYAFVLVFCTSFWLVYIRSFPFNHFLLMLLRVLYNSIVYYSSLVLGLSSPNERFNKIRT